MTAFRHRAPLLRTLEMCALYSGGDTLEAIAARYGITRERVRQLIRPYGLKHPGSRVVDPFKVLGAIRDSLSMADIARRLGVGEMAVAAVLNALAPIAKDEMAAYRYESKREGVLQRIRRPHLTPAARVKIALRYDPSPQVGQRGGNVAQLAAEYGITVRRVHQIGKQYQTRTTSTAAP